MKKNTKTGITLIATSLILGTIIPTISHAQESNNLSQTIDETNLVDDSILAFSPIILDSKSFIDISPRAIATPPEGSSKFSYATTINFTTGNHTAKELAGTIAAGLAGLFVPSPMSSSFAGLASQIITVYGTGSNKYGKDIVQYYYSGKTRVLRHNIYIYSDSARTKLIKSYWTETI